jgi:deoxyribose-phosphate aldolase
MKRQLGDGSTINCEQRTKNSGRECKTLLKHLNNTNENQGEAVDYSSKQIADVLDFAVLDPRSTIEDIEDGAALCNKHNIKSYCVSSANVKIATSHPNVCAVIGFPHGNVHPFVKFQEAVCAINDGATELDVVINFGRFIGGDRKIVLKEMSQICNYAHHQEVLVKAILETGALSGCEIETACRLCIEAECDMVKTSTCSPGATVSAVEIMLDTVRGTGVRVKASGGIKCYDDVVRFLDLGVSRIGSSSYFELFS